MYGYTYWGESENHSAISQLTGDPHDPPALSRGWSANSCLLLMKTLEMEERMACGEREDGNKSLEKWCELEESIVRRTTHDGHNRHFTFHPVYRITSVIR